MNQEIHTQETPRNYLNLDLKITGTPVPNHLPMMVTKPDDERNQSMIISFNCVH